ncbi:NAD(P)H-dependent oxidoreductase [Pendulispora albinea]|uniref:NAD(P)H-dependent oxidoreductase n=1 Tax=Pendulispora albinea TaxID=2741071 RepID=A0ABZ2LXK2_9BACT
MTSKGRRIVFVGGSPSPTSRSRFVATAVAKELESEGFAADHFSLHDFDAEDVFLARTSASKIVRYLDAVKEASAIVLSTPVYKATYAGALKAIVDLLPQDALVSRPALGIATTRLEAHGREVDGAYQSLFAFFRARSRSSLIVLDDELRIDGTSGTFTQAAEDRVRSAARSLLGDLHETAV